MAYADLVRFVIATARPSPVRYAVPRELLPQPSPAKPAAAVAVDRSARVR